MGFDKEKIKQIRWLMILAAVLILLIIYSDTVLRGIGFALGIAKPFLYGGAIAFVLNIPMRMYENKLLKRWRGKAAGKLKRPVCMVLSILTVFLIFTVVIGTIVPQVTATAAEVGKKIPAFVERVVTELEKVSKEYPELNEQIEKLEDLDVNWGALANNAIDFLKNGMSSMLISTVNVASGIIGGVMNVFIAIVFAFYILSQKEKLANQAKRIISAYCPERVSEKIQHVCVLLHKNFSNFITGQCLEAVILGTMFVVAMSLFRMPYAFMVGVMIAFFALIPIVGAFIGCFVGAFLILIDNPIMAIWFVVLFLVLQQIEGNLIYPKVVGTSVGLPSIWVLMAVSLGGSLFGVMGMLVFIPLLSTFYTLLRESVNARNGAKKKLEGSAGTLGCAGIVADAEKETGSTGKGAAAVEPVNAEKPDNGPKSENAAKSVKCRQK